MTYNFKAKIYKTGINWCVDVPLKITDRLEADRGRISISGKICGFHFTKTLMPVKDGPYRLFVNQAMMKGGKTALGRVATFEIKQDTEKVTKEYPIPLMLTEDLKKHRLTAAFEDLSASRKREILKYLSYVKTEATMRTNIDKLVIQLKSKEKNVRIP